ncbi:TPA: hypothetical protein ACG3QY_001761 [Clostridioides difficile]
MNRMIWFVFKTLASFMILMVLVNIVAVCVDSLVVHSRVEALSIVMQNEIARNNCIPKSITPLFERQLNSIVEQSNVATEIKSNVENSLMIEGTQYQAIDEEHVKEYGDIQTLAIRITMNPSSVVVSRKDGALLELIKDYKYELNYKYTVPCLRYLK